MRIEEWLGDNELAINIWKNKYQQDNESFEDWLDRITGNNEALKQKVLEKKFLFGGRILSNRGISNKGVKAVLSNCYVIKNPQDNIEDIYRCCSDLARTYSMGGGCGICLDNLRPRNAKVNNSAKTTTGAVSFMDTFSKVSETIGQNGRRGALMLALDVNHPDIEEFIDCKTDLNRVLGANISVKVDDEFMKKVKNNETHVCEFYVQETNEKIVREFNARELFNKLVQNNFNYAEPGILYWSTFNKHSLLSEYIKNDLFEYGGTNPCAEEPLPEGGACLLGSINLSEYVKYPFTKYAEFDFANFEKDIPLYVTALNDCLEENQDLHPLDYQRECAKEWKQIGLGIMGLADVFIKMGIQYGSQESLDLIDEIGHMLAYVSLLTSSQLNIEKGEAPFSKSGHYLLADSWFVNNHSNEDIDANVLKDRIKAFGLYNSALLTVAPTGSISTMLGTSGGIEPIFATSYNRRTISLNDEETTYKVYTPVIQQLMDALDIDNEEDLPSYVITSHEIKPLNRIKVQSTMQEHIDASISSTINLKEDATFDDVYEIYMQAWEYGLKGVTIYRDNCKRQGILTTEPKKEDNSAEVEANNSDNAIPRGYILPTNDDVIGLKRKIVGGCGSLHLQVYFDYNTGNMTEVFINKGGSGGCNSNLNALSRMISLALRGGISIEDIVDQLSSTINCPSFASARAKGIQLSPGSSCANAVGKTLLELDKEFKEMFTKVLKEENNTNIDDIDDAKKQEYLAYIEKHGQIEFVKTYHKCPDCFDDIMASGGCYQCNSCGFSKCE